MPIVSSQDTCLIEKFRSLQGDGKPLHDHVLTLNVPAKSAPVSSATVSVVDRVRIPESLARQSQEFTLTLE